MFGKIHLIFYASILGLASAKARKVLLIGPTGVGKSFIGNALLGGKRAFVVRAGDGHSVTETTDMGQAMVNVGKEIMNLTVWDTPGLGDTEGRSLSFLDLIMKRLRSVQPDAVVLVTNDQRFTLEVQVGLRAFKECFAEALLPHRVILLANKMVTPFQLENGDPPITDEKDQQAHIQNLTERRRQEVSKYMGLVEPEDMLTTVFANSAEKKDAIPGLLTAIHGLPDSEWNVDGAKTFTQVMRDANSAVNDQENLARQADEMKARTQRRINGLQKDLEYYESSITDNTAATGIGAAVGGLVLSAMAGPAAPAALLIFGTAFAGGLSVAARKAYVSTQASNIKKLFLKAEADMDELRDQQQAMIKRKNDAERFLRDMRQLEALLGAKLNESHINEI